MNNSSKDNHKPAQGESQALDFFEAIFGQTNGFLEIRAFPSDSNKPIQQFFPAPSELDKASIFATELKSQVFYGAAPRARQGGKGEDVAALVTVWVDGDAEKGALPWTILPLKPTAVVDSGNPSGRNYHGYYALNAPLELKTEAGRNMAKVYLDALSATLKGDPKSCDIARILRVPGTYNTKDPNHPRLCRIIELNPDARYSLEQIREGITLSLVIRHWERGQRQDIALSLTGYLAKCDTPESEVSKLLSKLLSMTGDEEPRSRLGALEASYKKLHEGKKVKGYQGLSPYLNKEELQVLESLWGTPKGLAITIDGVTYYESSNRIMSRYQPLKEDALPIIKTLASFTIEPKMRITLEGESERLATALKADEVEYPCMFKREAWNSKRQLLAALPSVDLQYYGTDKDTQAILAMVTSEELPIRRGTTVLGRNGDLWVLRDGVISQDGWVENPPLVYIPSEVEFDRRVHYPVPEDETALIKQIIPQLFILNEGRIIFPILGWFFATPFVPEVRHRLRHFPLLVVWGTHGGGKSSLLSLLWELFGVKSELFSSTETPFTFLRLFSGTSTIPILIDEFKPFTMKEDETRLLIRFLRRLYDGEIEHRGRPDLSLVAYHLQAPTAIAGEVTPVSLESAMVERVIQVNLNPDTLTANSPYVKAFNELARLDLSGFAFPYIRWCLATSLADLMTEARALLPVSLRDVPPRARDNALVMSTGLLALKHFAAAYGMQIADEDFRTGIRESINELLVELFERGVYQEIGLTIFLETLATLAQTGRVKHGVHYTTDDINTRLYIHLPDCLAEFRKFVRETNARVEVLDERAYRRQAREVSERKGYVLNTFANKWFKMYKTEKGEMGKIRSCMEIDLEQLPFDTSGFEEPVGD